MKITKNKRMPRFRVMAAMSFIGLPLTALFVIFLKKNQVYENEYEFGRKITVFFFVTAVIVPLALYALRKRADRIKQRRLKKFGPRKESRERRYQRRINKVLTPYHLPLSLLVLFYMYVSMCLALGIRRLQVPEGNLEEDTPTIILMISLMVLLTTLGTVMSLIISSRIFKKKNGVKKALKYFFVLKKPPKLLDRLWLKASGFSNDEINNYLQNLNKKTSENTKLSQPTNLNSH